MDHHKPYLLSGIMVYINKLMTLSIFLLIIIGFISTYSKTTNKPIDEYQKEIPFKTSLELMEGQYDDYSNLVLHDIMSSNNNVIPTNYLDETSTLFSNKNI